MESGFHSLVKVLIDGGAQIEEPTYSPLQHAVQNRRLDLVKLLVEKGAKIRSIDITGVFAHWDPEMVEYFIDQAADLETGNPVAWALCQKIRPALGLLKRYADRFPSFREQANIALRHHCREGSLKWASLMLWAGGDPYSRGADSPEQEPDPEEDNNALENAAFHGHLDIFKLKAIHLDPKRPDSRKLVENACHAEKSDVLRFLLGRGFDPQEWEDKGSPLIQSLFWSMSFDWEYSPVYGFKKNEKDLDTRRSRESIKMMHLLVNHGAQWKPDRQGINHARRSLMKMVPDYTVEFVWIMSRYKACAKEHIEHLLRPAPIRILVEKHQKRLDELIAALK